MNHITKESIYPADAWDILHKQLTEKRQEKLLSRSQQRTSHIRLVLQDIHHPHNVSACLRSAEAFGIQKVDIISDKKSFRPTTVAKGVSSWLDITVHYQISDYAKSIKEKGYKLYAGMPSDTSQPLEKVDVDQPLAILFGNEKHGVYDEWLPHLDGMFTIPMSGFVESLNISVSAAITLHYLTNKAKDQLRENYFLSNCERAKVLNQWSCQNLPSWETMYRALKDRKINSTHC